ncbi:MAG: preprotein translocase subunit SecG [Comamonas sp. SCN 65-56]|uniref:preprotein translocase subunit SecG n=1 Tax=Comamonas sp. SCN 65-56 TaxID=1660095 RepID=UPI00086B14E2|nr:preprotein translocase subunit SecG [Comamonas sp. SCN 65-56]ODS91141.1 MAG: preprotein translocase subunit SecG [Comamonas sp. SCN 65-56]
MHLLINIVFAVQMLAAVAMIGLILIQHGKGADMGAAFGSGSAGSVFGASGSANFLSRSTAVLATVFFIATLTLAYFGNQRPANNSVDSVLERSVSTVPAAPKPATDASAAAGSETPAKAGTDSSQQIPTK